MLKPVSLKQLDDQHHEMEVMIPTSGEGVQFSPVAYLPGILQQRVSILLGWDDVARLREWIDEALKQRPV